MVGPLLSVLLLGMVPVWGVGDPGIPGASDLGVAAPLTASLTESIPRLLAGGLSASGVLIVDLESAQTLYAEHPLEQRPMASLTKLMTALIIVENHSLDEMVTIPPAVKAVDSNAIGLQPGDEYALGDVLTALLVYSANDAAVALAVHHSGNEQAFVAEMNARAATLGLSDTAYRNATGFDASGQHTTPRDLGVLSSFVLSFPAIANRMSLSSASIQSRSGTVLNFSSTHQMLHRSTEIVAGKTGTTDAAGQCLLSVFEEAGHRYAAVLLHSADRYGDMRRILAAFNK